jgi:hypothetical protein
MSSGIHFVLKVLALFLRQVAAEVLDASLTLLLYPCGDS